MSSIVASGIEEWEDLSASTANDFRSGVFDSDEENVEIEDVATAVDKSDTDVDETRENNEPEQKVANNLFFSVNTSEDQIVNGQFIRGETDALKFPLKMVDLIIEQHESANNPGGEIHVYGKAREPNVEWRFMAQMRILTTIDETRFPLKVVDQDVFEFSNRSSPLVLINKEERLSHIRIEIRFIHQLYEKLPEFKSGDLKLNFPNGEPLFVHAGLLALMSPIISRQLLDKYSVEEIKSGEQLELTIDKCSRDAFLEALYQIYLVSRPLWADFRALTEASVAYDIQVVREKLASHLIHFDMPLFKKLKEALKLKLHEAAKDVAFTLGVSGIWADAVARGMDPIAAYGEQDYIKVICPAILQAKTSPKRRPRIPFVLKPNFQNPTSEAKVFCVPLVVCGRVFYVNRGVLHFYNDSEFGRGNDAEYFIRCSVDLSRYLDANDLDLPSVVEEMLNYMYPSKYELPIEYVRPIIIIAHDHKMKHLLRYMEDLMTMEPPMTPELLLNHLEFAQKYQLKNLLCRTLVRIENHFLSVATQMIEMELFEQRIKENIRGMVLDHMVSGWAQTSLKMGDSEQTRHKNRIVTAENGGPMHFEKDDDLATFKDVGASDFCLDLNSLPLLDDLTSVFESFKTEQHLDDLKNKMETNDPVVKRIPHHLRPGIVIAAGIVMQASFGIVYTFGNILPYLVSYLRWKVDPHQTNGSMIWLQSFMSGIPFAALFGGYLERKLGARKGAIIGSVLYTSSIALSFYAIQYSYVLLLIVMGFFGTFGQGIAYNCVLIQAQKWLPERVGLASGLIVAGFGSGAFLMAPIQTKFINPNNYHVDSEGFFTQTDLLERVPYLFLLLAGIFTILQVFGLIFIADPLPAEDDDSSESISLLTSIAEPEIISMKQILASWTFRLLFATLFLNAIFVQISSGLFKAYGMKFIKDDFFLATVSSFAAATNCVSRIFWGMLMDNTSYQVSMVIACAVGSSLIWTLGIIRQWNEANAFFFWICGMFSIIGATYTLLPSAVHKCFGSQNFGIAYGFVQLSMTISGIATALLSQFLLPIWGYEKIFLIGGCTLVGSFVLTTLVQQTEYGKGMSSRPRSSSSTILKMYKLLVVLALVAAVQAGGYGVPRGGSSSSSEEDNNRRLVKCLKDVTFEALVDNQKMTVNCGDQIVDTSAGVSFADRCIGCCSAWAFAKNYRSNSVVGFVSNTGKNCVCCRDSGRGGRRYD
uniref:Major facilitator superfamily (MFS) profile domain-containing protein n=1 Tax=Panagrolaimus sp. JU765 TaxID=591449 RepID=A0AC34QMX0_9BILA